MRNTKHFEIVLAVLRYWITIVILGKFETNLKLHMEITRYLPRACISYRLQKYLYDRLSDIEVIVTRSRRVFMLYTNFVLNMQSISCHLHMNFQIAFKSAKYNRTNRVSL